MIRTLLETLNVGFPASSATNKALWNDSQHRSPPVIGQDDGLCLITQNRARPLPRSYRPAPWWGLLMMYSRVLTLSGDRGLCSGCCSAGWKKEKKVLRTTPADTRHIIFVIILITFLIDIIIWQPSLPWLHPPARRWNWADWRSRGPMPSPQ